MENEQKEKIEKFLHSKGILKELRRVAAAGRKSLVITFERLLEFDMGLAKHLLDSPSDFFNTAGLLLEGITKIPGLRLRVAGLDKSTVVHNVHAEHVGKFIQVEGILTRSSEVKPEVTEAVFRCRRCGEENRILQVGDLFREPLICENPNCGGKNAFDFVVESTAFRDWQSLCLQEPPETLRGGRMPRRLDCIVRDDFVDKAVPGNHVVITGVLRVVREGRRHERKKTFRKILFVSHNEVLQKGVEEAELTPDDNAKIKELAKDPWIRNKIIQSIAPSIYGYEAIKEAIALQLFGSESVDLFDGTRIRGDIHVLLTGDPGTAKSQLLKWAANAAPRGLYTSGPKASGVGLTAATVRDELSGSWSLEAGAMVIADGGLAAIDELDKMDPKESNALLEALEQQTVSVAKAGIVATLNTRTALLAGANPKHGRWEPNLNFSEQINIDPVLLSRFDIFFVVRDVPTPDGDRAVAEHIANLHISRKLPTRPPMSTDFLRKVIIYSRKNLDPKLSKEAAKVATDFFVEWRGNAKSQGNPVPIAIRQYEGIIRLAKANARMGLSDRVTVEDANRAITLIKRSLQEAGVDVETGKHDIDILMTGKSKSQHDKVKRIYEIIKELEGEHGGAAPIDEVKRITGEEGISSSFVNQT
ncbi:unnamed protein product, partial [marine sediment metagenome]